MQRMVCKLLTGDRKVFFFESTALEPGSTRLLNAAA